MQLYHYSLLIIFGVILYMMSVDKNVAEYIVLNVKLLQINIQRWRWMFINHPDNFITTWWRMRAYKKFIKEYQTSLESVQSKTD